MSIAYVPSIVLSAGNEGMNRTDQDSDLKKINVMGVGEERRGKSLHQIELYSYSMKEINRVMG